MYILAISVVFSITSPYKVFSRICFPENLRNNDFALSISSALHPNKQKSVPIILGFWEGIISACNVVISSNPFLDAFFNVIQPYLDIIFIFIPCLYKVANASLSPTPKRPIKLLLFNFSSFSFCVK